MAISRQFVNDTAPSSNAHFSQDLSREPVNGYLLRRTQAQSRQAAGQTAAVESELIVMNLREVFVMQFGGYLDLDDGFSKQTVSGLHPPYFVSFAVSKQINSFNVWA